MQVSSKITYKLWAGDGRDGISTWLCMRRGRSRTNCGRAMGETESVPGCACIEEDHIQAGGGRWARRRVCVSVHASRKITYRLGVDDERDGVSVWLCSFQARSRTSCERAMGETE